MKKKIGAVLLTVALVVGLSIPMAIPVAANMVTPEPPPGAECMTLYAGQDINVGCVYVWNDADNLYVKYETTGGWVMTETHLHVATSVEDIPQTKTGNPVPGKFALGDTFDPPQDWAYYTYKMDSGTAFTIAAHAVVKKLVSVETFNECLVSGEGTDNVLYLDEDPGNPGYPLGYTDPYQTYPGTTILSFMAWTHSAWAPYGVAGAQWISSSYLTENTDYNTWRLFTRSFSLPDTAINISGELTMNCDNAEEVYLNGTFVGDGGYGSIVYGPSVKDVSPPSGDAHGWNHIDGPWDVGSELIAGSNELWTMTRNYAWSGGPTANPTGLVYKLCYSYDIETWQTETAWAANGEEPGVIQFPGKNWATYFEYTIPPCMTPSGSLSVTGTGWKSVAAWCPCAYTYDLTDGTVALMGWVDLSGAAVANTGAWSKYYAKFYIQDSSGHKVEVVFCNDWLGPWYEMDAQQWDRIRMENNMGLAQPLQYYATVGGVLGYDMDGNWVGAGSGAIVYPSDGNYFFQLIVDPSAETFTLQVYAKGSSMPVADPPPSAKPGWPKQNMFNEAKWLEIGTINVFGKGFDFAEVNLCAILWASTQAGAGETTTIYWDGMVRGTPVTFGDIPE